MLEQSTHAAAPVDRLMSRLIDFETVADASATTAGEPAGGAPSGTEPVAAADGGAAGEAVTPPAAATDAAPAATPFDPSDPAVGEILDAMLEQRLSPLLQLLQGDDGGGAGAPAGGGFDASQIDLDPFGEDFGSNLGRMLAASNQQLLEQVGQMFGQVAQPLQQRIEAETTAEGNQRLADILADDISRNGDFPRLPGQTESQAEKLVRPIAESLFTDLAARYGVGPRTAEMAMTQAAATVRAIVNEAGGAAVEAYKNQLAGLAGAPTEPGGAAVGAQGLSPVRARTMEEGLSAVTARHAAALRGGA